MISLTLLILIKKGMINMKWKIETETKTIAGIVDNVLAIVDETQMVIRPDGLHISAVDPAHVCMLILDVPKSAFKTWQFDGDEEVEIGLMLNKINQYLKIYGKDELLTIGIDDGLTRMEIKGSDIGNIHHKTPLLDVDGMTTANKPELELEDGFKIEGRYLHTAIKGAVNIAEIIIVSLDKDHVRFAAEEDEDSINVTIYEHDLKEIRNPGGKQNSMYALDYIRSLGNMVSANTIMDIGIGSNYPLIAKFPIAESGTAEFLCAPRIEGTEDIEEDTEEDPEEE